MHSTTYTLNGNLKRIGYTAIVILNYWLHYYYENTTRYIIIYDNHCGNPRYQA